MDRPTEPYILLYCTVDGAVEWVGYETAEDMAGEMGNSPVDFEVPLKMLKVKVAEINESPQGKEDGDA